MAGVAYDGSLLTEVIKPSHVTYDVYTWERVGRTCVGGRDEFGNCLGWRDDYDWVFSHSSSTGAKINGSVNSSGNVYVNGIPIAKASDGTSEQWIADPPVPSNTPSTQYRNVSPAHFGSGSGSISFGNNSNVYANGKSVAIVGSTVSTHINYNTTIQNGSPSVFIG